MTNNEYVLFDNYNGFYEEAKEQLEETCEEYSEEQIYEVENMIEEDYFELAMEELNEYFNHVGNRLLYTGYIDRWNGKHTGFSIVDNFDELFTNACKDCSYFKIYIDEDEEDTFYIQCSHHDGTNLFKVYIMTEEAEQLLENYEYCDSKLTASEFVEGLMLKGCIKTPNFINWFNREKI